MAMPSHPPMTALAVLQAAIFTVDQSLAHLARRSGVSLTTIHRLLRARQHPRLEGFFALMARLGIGLLVRSPAESRWRALTMPATTGPLPDGATLAELVADRLRQVPVSDLSRDSRRRLIRGKLPPMVNAVFALLGAVGGTLIALAGDGAARELPLPEPRPSAGSPISTAVRSRARAAAPAQIRLSKRDILILHRDAGRPVAEIAAIAGVTPERIRQILVLLGVPSARERQRQARIAAYRRFPTPPPRC